MESTPIETEAAKPWGHQHPNCKGEAAIAFFTADLSRTVEEHLAHRDVTDEALQDAQRAVDRLLRIYVALQAAPHAFEGQKITLNIAFQTLSDGHKSPYVALETTPTLETMIIEMQEREHTGLA